MIYKNQNTMRKGILLIFTVLATLVGCGQYDDSELKSDINDLKSRMAALEKQCKNMNENLTSLQAIVNASQKQDGIVSVTDLPDGQGYSVKFVSGKVIYLYNGTNGTGSSTPKISVRQDSDGIYYWTVDGEWLIVDGKKVRASATDGKDAVTPQFKIEDGFWFVSYDGGNSWTKLAKATGDDGKDGDGFFKSVTVENGYMVLVINDSEQTTLRIPVAGTSAVTSIKYVPDNLDGVVKVRYSKNGDKYVPEDIPVNFEILPRSAVEYLVKNWKNTIVAKAVYVASTRAEIGDFVTMNIKDVVFGKDNILTVSVDASALDSQFFASNTPMMASLRLTVKVNGDEELSSDYVPIAPLSSNDNVIEYLTEYDRTMDDGSFSIGIYDSPIEYDNHYVGSCGRITFESVPNYKIPFRCEFSNIKLESLKFATPIELSRLSFSGCNNLTNVDLSNIDTHKVTDMSGMFAACYNLTSLDLSNFNTEKAVDMSCMFSDCGSLNNLDLSAFDTKKVTNMSGMFSYCCGLTNLDLSSFNTSNVTDMSLMFSTCSNLTVLDLSKFDTRAVTNMSGMFSGCKSLTSLDLSSFDTRNVTNMSGMFSGCKSLTSLNLSSFDTKSVTDMSNMFSGCQSLTSLDLSNFDTGAVTNMYYMFSGCKSLTNVDLSYFNTRTVVRMDFMFSSCTGLKSVNLSNLHADELDTYRMFYGCTNLIKVNLSNLRARSLQYMFMGCTSLASIDLSEINTEKLWTMVGMFVNCTNLTSVNLSNLDLRNVSLSRIFDGCTNLETVDLSNSSIGYVYNIFKSCSNLKKIIMRGCDKETIEAIRRVKPESAVIVTE